jgi:hypothetical protein
MAGALNYTALVERITQCIQAGKCIKVEAYISMAEVMVDEEIIKVQREKVGLLKSYFAKNRDQFRSNDYCYILESFSPILEKMQSLNRTRSTDTTRSHRNCWNTIPEYEEGFVYSNVADLGINSWN